MHSSAGNKPFGHSVLHSEQTVSIWPSHPPEANEPASHWLHSAMRQITTGEVAGAAWLERKRGWGKKIRRKQRVAEHVFASNSVARTARHAVVPAQNVSRPLMQPPLVYVPGWQMEHGSQMLSVVDPLQPSAR